MTQPTDQQIMEEVKDEIAYQMFKSPYWDEELNRRGWDALPEYQTKAHYRNLADIALSGRGNIENDKFIPDPEGDIELVAHSRKTGRIISLAPPPKEAKDD